MNRLIHPARMLAAAALALPSALLAITAPAQAADYVTGDGAGYSGPTEVVWGSTIRIEGTGWKHSDGSGSGVIAKLDASPNTTAVQTTRPVADPVNGGNFADKTVHGAVVADADGDWRLDIPFPTSLNSSTDWLPGETHFVRLLSGNLKSGDTARSAAVEFEIVEPSNECTNTNAQATISTPTAELGGKVRVTGTGWCHPSEGASAIAVKLDQGAHSRVAGILEGDATIWARIAPDPLTGAFDTEITLPDGTLATSKDADGKAFGEGGHWFNLLTGSLKPGDVGRSIRLDFTVGAYSPNGAPDPLGDDELTAGSRAGVEVRRTAKAVKVTVPSATQGDWVHLDLYAGGAPQALWGGTTWFRVGAGGVVTAPLKGITLPEGRNKLTVQSGNQGEVGRLIGWAPLKVKAAEETEKSTPPKPKGNPSAATGTAPGAAPAAPAAPASAAAVAAPAETPGAPVEAMEQLDSGNAGKVSSVLEGSMLVLSVEDGVAGQWVHAWLYDASGRAALGWAQLDAQGQLRVDVGALGSSRFKLAVQDEAGALLGWTGGGVDAPAETAVAAADIRPTAAASLPAAETTSPVLLNVALSGIGLLCLIGSSAALFANRAPSGKEAS